MLPGRHRHPRRVRARVCMCVYQTAAVTRRWQDFANKHEMYGQIRRAGPGARNRGYTYRPESYRRNCIMSSGNPTFGLCGENHTRARARREDGDVTNLISNYMRHVSPRRIICRTSGELFPREGNSWSKNQPKNGTYCRHRRASMSAKEIDLAWGCLYRYCGMRRARRERHTSRGHIRTIRRKTN